MKKRLLALFVAIIMVMPMIVACGNGGGAGGGGDFDIAEPGQFPIVPNMGDLHFTFMVVDHPAIMSWDNNYFIQWMTEMTNITLDFEAIPTEGRHDRLNIILSAGDIPDALIIDLTDAQVMRFGVEEGMFLALNDLIDDYGHYIHNVFEQFPMALNLSTMENGNIYSLPSINDAFHVYMHNRMWINQVWLDNLGLEVPTTTDEFFDVLVAFRDNDANGNGDPNDEIPLAGATNMWGGQVDHFIMNAFTHYVIQMEEWNTSNTGLWVDDGTIVHSFNDPGFREGLMFLNRMFEEGLIHPASFNQNMDQVTAMAENPAVNILGAAPAGFIMFATMGGERYSEYTAVYPLAGPNGFRNVVANPYVPVSRNRATINLDAPNPEAIFRWIDLLYDEVATLNSYYGPQDVAWEWAQDGDIGLDGNPALYRQLIPWQETEPQNYHLVQQIPDLRSSRIRLGLADNPDLPLHSADRLETMLYAVALEYWQFAQPDRFRPPLRFTVEEADATMLQRVEVNRIIQESITAFIMGTLSVELDFDNFVAELYAAGLGDIMEQEQAAFDAQWR